MTPTQATATPDQLHAWLESLGDKFLGDGVRESMRASDILAALRRSSVPTPMSDSNDAIKADWDRVMSGLAPMSDSTDRLDLPPLPKPRWDTNKADEQLFTASQMQEYALAARRPLETCQCAACRPTIHASCCAVHNEPAFPTGPCDCGAIQAAMSDSTAAAPEVTDAMVDAYLKANDAYWKRTDELPISAKNPGRWREGTPREATRESLRAALGVDSTVAAAGGDERAWLVEYSGKMLAALGAEGADAREAIQYLSVQPKGYGAGELVLHADPNRALRFARKEDAEAALTLYAGHTNRDSPTWIGNYLSAKEHMWCASLSATPADIRGLARAELRQTRVPAPAVAAITERQESVHPASGDRTVTTSAPFSEPSACESSELPVRPTHGT